eukprot:TRINITY_DN34159_c0_g1_i4.p1 TRINITY_DN34159_c0_g1~~TRINITY_DN34159_c0_g1_i4.p1  ORF type:complete len:297 (+),score=-27.11 TRINITY_DN34159_c0_g1_i4:129-893(+)
MLILLTKTPSFCNSPLHLIYFCYKHTFLTNMQANNQTLQTNEQTFSCKTPASPFCVLFQHSTDCKPHHGLNKSNIITTTFSNTCNYLKATANPTGYQNYGQCTLMYVLQKIAHVQRPLQKATSGLRKNSTGQYQHASNFRRIQVYIMQNSQIIVIQKNCLITLIKTENTVAKIQNVSVKSFVSCSYKEFIEFSSRIYSYLPSNQLHPDKLFNYKNFSLKTDQAQYIRNKICCSRIQTQIYATTDTKYIYQITQY